MIRLIGPRYSLEGDRWLAAFCNAAQDWDQVSRWLKDLNELVERCPCWHCAALAKREQITFTDVYLTTLLTLIYPITEAILN
jgi:hypothetical protein